jgi:hypothetical protein
MGAGVSNNVLVTGATRLPTRFTNRPALVKIAFQNLDEKILVLRNKMVLKDLEAYTNIYLKSCMSRVERLVEMNARAVLRQLPQGKEFRVNASGRIIQRARHQDNMETAHSTD